MLAVCLFSLMGYANAANPNENMCLTVRITCPDGENGGTNLVTCGTEREQAEDAKAVLEVVCG